MSPSGSRTQTGGTFVAPSPFWRRASRKSAEGAKTDLAAGFLFLSNGGITETSCAGTLKHNAIVIGWNFDNFYEFQAASHHRLNRVFWRHSQFCFWASRLSKDGRLLARALVPIDDCKIAICFQCCLYSLSQSWAIRDAMKCICQKNKVRWSGQFGNVVCVTSNEIAICYSIFH